MTLLNICKQGLQAIDCGVKCPQLCQDQSHKTYNSSIFVQYPDFSKWLLSSCVLLTTKFYCKLASPKDLVDKDPSCHICRKLDIQSRTLWGLITSRYFCLCRGKCTMYCNAMQCTVYTDIGPNTCVISKSVVLYSYNCTRIHAYLA